MKTLALLLALAPAFALTACASTTSKHDDHVVTHSVSPQDLTLAQSREPLRADAATLYVNGLGCPLCASNIDRQLHRVEGLEVQSVDLSNGKVNVAFSGPSRPSPYAIGHAVEDAGFTLVKIEAK